MEPIDIPQVANVRTWLRDLRKKRGLSQNKLSRVLDVTSTTVANWENGRQDVAGQHQIRLIRVLGREVADHFRDELLARAEQVPA